MRASFSGLDDLREQLDGVKDVEKEVRNVLLRAAASTRVRATKLIGEKVFLKASEIKKRIFISASNDQIGLTFSKRPISIRNFKVRNIMKPIRRPIKKGRDPLPGVAFRTYKDGPTYKPRGSFVAENTKLKYWNRVRKGTKLVGRTPIRPLRGPAINSVVKGQPGLLDELADYAGDRVLVETERLLSRVVRIGR